MSIQKIPVPGSTFNTEIANAQVPLTVLSYALSGSTLTVTTTAAHGLAVGDTVVITNAAAGFAETAWKVQTVPSNTTFTIDIGTNAEPTNGTSPADSVIPVVYLPPGCYYAALGANATVEYNPGNTGHLDGPSSAAGATWRTAIAASGSGFFWSDSYGVRLRCGGSAGTSYYSQVE